MVRFFLVKTDVLDTRTEMRMNMADKYFVVKQKALPEVLLKVVEAKRLLEAEKC